MKKHILVILTACLCCCAANAQWYLFPGSPQRADSVSVARQQEENAAEQLLQSPADTAAVVSEDPAAVDADVVKVALILPLFNNDVPSTNFLDLYSGAILAARETAERGVSVRLSVYDTAEDSLRYDSSLFYGNDVIIGPVSVPDLRFAASRCPDDVCIVSPLDPMAGSLVTECNVIQSPSRVESQIDGLVSWLASETTSRDAVVLLQNDMEEAGESAPYLVSRLNSSGIVYTICSDPSTIACPSSGCTRFVLVSENTTFCSDCVREVALRAVKDENVALYGISKLRSINEIEPASLHAAGARICVSYYADPSDPEVEAFGRNYRALFHSEPGSFAYQGYDLVKYYATLCSMYGRGWHLNLTEHPWAGLHTSFRFEDSVCAGRSNLAVRRLRYLKDNTIQVENK